MSDIFSVSDGHGFDMGQDAMNRIQTAGWKSAEMKPRSPYPIWGKEGLWICYGSNDWPSASTWLVAPY